MPIRAQQCGFRRCSWVLIGPRLQALRSKSLARRDGVRRSTRRGDRRAASGQPAAARARAPGARDRDGDQRHPLCRYAQEPRREAPSAVAAQPERTADFRRPRLGPGRLRLRRRDDALATRQLLPTRPPPHSGSSRPPDVDVPPVEAPLRLGAPDEPDSQPGGHREGAGARRRELLFDTYGHSSETWAKRGEWLYTLRSSPTQTGTVVPLGNATG